MTKLGMHILLAALAMFSVLTPLCTHAQATTFEGIDASQVTGAQFDVDPNGAVGTKQYMEWVNDYYQAWDKVTFAPVWSTPQTGWQPWINSNMTNCYGFGGGDGLVMFDHLASRWIIAKRAFQGGSYYYCVAISNTDDLTSPSLSWYAYEIALDAVLGSNSRGAVYYPDWPKLGTWWNAYYVSFDLEDVNSGYQEIGVVVCALDRTSMLAGAPSPRSPQCFSDPSPIPLNGSLYYSHSLIPADVDGTTSPSPSRHGFLISIENPPNDGNSTTSNTVNLWDFKLSWTNPANSTFGKTAIAVPTYTPGCYDVTNPVNTICVPESTTKSTGNYIDSVGDRMMPRLDYRNFGTYESFLVSQTVQTGTGSNTQTGIRWYEFRGSGTPALYQSGTINYGTAAYRFMPSMAQDHSGNAAVGYSMSSGTTHPSIRASRWNLVSKTAPVEFNILNGAGDQENTYHWGDYTSMTVDPVDDCTFWYVNQYLSANQTGHSISWKTRVSKFKLAGCN